MKKRDFLNVSVLGAAASALAIPAPASARAKCRAAPGPALLTVSGRIGAGNRGPFDPALDQMMAKQKISFERAHALDFAALAALPAVTIRPTLEYDAKPHTLEGPLLLDVVKACGSTIDDKTVFLLRAVDGYAAQVSASDARKYRYIVSTHLDGKPMALGGLGPLWAVYDADRFADRAAMPLPARFAACPWAIYHIEVRQG